MQLKPWIAAARLRTLPLAVANIILGSLIACSEGKFKPAVFITGLLTAVFLQILSNYANDYGDFVNGADRQRVSKYERSLQSGKISPRQMRWMLAILSILTLITGIVLISFAAKALGIKGIILFLGIGLLCITAAITYTVGDKPYGYLGLGDISVFIFFGIVGVCGIYYLQSQQWNWFVLFPASSLGLLSTGVLTINNIRDFESDHLSGKKTLVVRIGPEKAKKYYAWLILLAILLGVTSTLLDYHKKIQFIYLLTVPFFIRSIFKVRSSGNTAIFDNELRNLSLTTLFYSVFYGLGLLL